MGLQAILGPILEDRITPFVRAAYPEICGNADVGRGCTPCYSLIRRYKVRCDCDCDCAVTVL